MPLIAIVLAMLLTISACTSNDRPATYLQPPPDAGLRPLDQPVLAVAEDSIRGHPGDYPALISNILATELSMIFDLPQEASAMVRSKGDQDLVPTLDAVTDEIIIPMVLGALDDEQKKRVSEARLRISLGDREQLYRLIIDAAMARLWQTASGDASSEAGYLQHLAARSSEPGASTFIDWQGVDGAVWKRRIADNLQPSGRPFAVLGMMTSHYLQTHIFSMIGYLVTRNLAEALIDNRLVTPKDKLRSRDDVQGLTASLMERAMLPLMGIDTLFSIAEMRVERSKAAIAYDVTLHGISAPDASASWPCARWQFFDSLHQRSVSDRWAAAGQDGAHEAHARWTALRLRQQEETVAQRLSAFLPGTVDNPIRFGGLDKETWERLSTEPIGCTDGGHADIAAASDAALSSTATPSGTSVIEQRTSPAQQGDLSCQSILDQADVLEDDQRRSAFCQLAERSFPDEAMTALLANIARGRLSEAERSALFVGIGLLEDEAVEQRTSAFNPSSPQTPSQHFRTALTIDPADTASIEGTDLYYRLDCVATIGGEHGSVCGRIWLTPRALGSVAAEQVLIQGEPSGLALAAAMTPSILINGKRGH